jgi:hypothetical protein
MYQGVSGVLVEDMLHPLIHAELVHAHADDLDRRLRAPKLPRAQNITGARRRRPLRRAARRIIRGLPRPA